MFFQFLGMLFLQIVTVHSHKNPVQHSHSKAFLGCHGAHFAPVPLCFTLLYFYFLSLVLGFHALECDLYKGKVFPDLFFSLLYLPNLEHCLT